MENDQLENDRTKEIPLNISWLPHIAKRISCKRAQVLIKRIMLLNDTFLKFFYITDRFSPLSTVSENTFM